MTYVNYAKKNKQIVVAKIDAQIDRILIYGEGYENDRSGYHVIADTKVKVKIGDRIEYLPEGVNFGWFVRVIT